MVAGERGEALEIMKWLALVGAVASALITTAAFAEVHVVNDPGGEVSELRTKFNALRKAGERLVIDGPCLSACTLFTGLSRTIMSA